MPEEGSADLRAHVFVESVGQHLRWFSTPEKAGDWAIHGGGGLWAYDRVGLTMFGSRWPVAGWISILLVIALTLCLFAYSFRMLTTPCRKAWSLAKYLRGDPIDPRVQLLPYPPGAPKAAKVAWFGPGAGVRMENLLYTDSIKGWG